MAKRIFIEYAYNAYNPDNALTYLLVVGKLSKTELAFIADRFPTVTQFTWTEFVFIKKHALLASGLPLAELVNGEHTNLPLFKNCKPNDITVFPPKRVDYTEICIPFAESIERVPANSDVANTNVDDTAFIGVFELIEQAQDHLQMTGAYLSEHAYITDEPTEQDWV